MTKLEDEPYNPFRGLLQYGPQKNKPERTIPTGPALNYFAAMSKAFAIMCSGHIYSIHENVGNISPVSFVSAIINFANPNKDGIFMRIEVCQLRRKMDKAEQWGSLGVQSVGHSVINHPHRHGVLLLTLLSDMGHKLE